MSVEIAGCAVERIGIVDDEPTARDGYQYTAEDLGVEAVPEEGPIEVLDAFVASTASNVQAVICDFRLRVRNYCPVDGAELAAKFYHSKVPAILCTKWEEARIDEIRGFLEFIPAMMGPDELTPETLRDGIAACIEEFRDEPTETRRLWRTLVRVEEMDEQSRMCYVTVPAWNPREVVRLATRHLPGPVVELLKPETRLFAKVNLGAERQQALYFTNWEVQ